MHGWHSVLTPTVAFGNNSVDSFKSPWRLLIAVSSRLLFLLWFGLRCWVVPERRGGRGRGRQGGEIPGRTGSTRGMVRAAEGCLQARSRQRYGAAFFALVPLPKLFCAIVTLSPLLFVRPFEASRAVKCRCPRHDRTSMVGASCPITRAIKASSDCQGDSLMAVLYLSGKTCPKAAKKSARFLASRIDGSLTRDLSRTSRAERTVSRRFFSLGCIQFCLGKDRTWYSEDVRSRTVSTGVPAPATTRYGLSTQVGREAVAVSIPRSMPFPDVLVKRCV